MNFYKILAFLPDIAHIAQKALCFDKL